MVGKKMVWSDLPYLTPRAPSTQTHITSTRTHFSRTRPITPWLGPISPRTRPIPPRLTPISLQTRPIRPRQSSQLPTKTEVDEFAELLLQSFLHRIPFHGWTTEHYFAFKEAVAVVIRGMQRPRLVFDAERDFLDWAISRFRWDPWSNWCFVSDNVDCCETTEPMYHM